MKFDVEMKNGDTVQTVTVEANSIQDAAVRLNTPTQRVGRVRPEGEGWVRVLVNRDGYCQFPRL